MDAGGEGEASPVTTATVCQTTIRATLAASSALLRLMLRVDSRVSSEKLGLFSDELLISVQ